MCNGVGPVQMMVGIDLFDTSTILIQSVEV